MRITIDTKHDSADDIRHAIRVLQTILQKRGETFTNQPAASTSSQLFNMFDSPVSSDTDADMNEPQQEGTTSQGIPMSMLTEATKRANDDDAPPKVELY